MCACLNNNIRKAQLIIYFFYLATKLKFSKLFVKMFSLILRATLTKKKYYKQIKITTTTKNFWFNANISEICYQLSFCFEIIKIFFIYNYQNWIYARFNSIIKNKHIIFHVQSLLIHLYIKKLNDQYLLYIKFLLTCN